MFELADGWERFRRIFLRLQILVSGEKSFEIPQWIVADRHLAEVVFPEICFEGAARERLAVYGDDLASDVEPGVGGGRNDEVHLRTRLPEGLGEFMRENQGEVATAGGEKRDGFVRSGPVGGNVVPIPAVEFKAVGVRLADK